ncbi:TPA: UDP-3-O-(3-hydroxymyristoyl)glucosamine N-acyltransferase [Klebsiella pneumoniae]|uniref:UDP-3-O-(3-hydroxymyristoyl)glucosamine N-acyltransferase n=1 Tax=Klebsiella pneumoniae complex TaxID=3390273 RepID=UPI000A1CB866|nr:UDP-3-O-(3-hydroxymyristoyl)glucosamine N-acyltransferase [Klebsiella variicola]MCE0162479.1 UDP-3-O-(3-hydroxymyristoyl)glucosamine N-acyltransferase [Klebsiella variicola subsp. variicola]HBW7834951.1 UDP-3-O-(3-hydroxymyristoyl)glucosamine N-acyltransferase [Klebsiella pneumoniae]HCT5786487.1 UDP-3-O-(3-hydroxymyristoyl)glucosamine N-acyltransferase [Klebsiella variicola]
MFSVMEIATLLSGSYTGDGAIRVNFIRPIRSPDVGGLAIVFAKQDLQFLSGSHADVLIGPDEILDSPAKAHIVISHLDVERLNLFLRSYKVKRFHLNDQGNTSALSDVYIGKHCQIGDGCIFMPGVKIMNGVIIGDNVAIHCNTVIKEGTIIGNNVTIDSNNSIGNYSFEYMASRNGKYQRVESVGRVIIYDDVEIGSNNTIDRGTLGNTTIGRGTKIDNQIQIGHDCHIGENCLIVSQAGFAGHTTLGDHVIVQGQVGTSGHIAIGSHSIIKAKSGVSHSFPENSDLFGYPAKDTRAYYKNIAVLNILTKNHQLKKNRSISDTWRDRFFNFLNS